MTLNEALSDDVRIRRLWKELQEEDRILDLGYRTKNNCVIGTKGGIHGHNNVVFQAAIWSQLESYPSGTFLDLGSGGGEIVIRFARKGWQSYGIDFCFNCYQVAQEEIARCEEEGHIPQGKAKIAWGNFFPPEFPVFQSQDRTEDSFRKDIANHLRDNHPSGNPYSRLGIALAEIDVWYHYQVERRENILRLFAEYAKSGAELFFISSFRDTFTVPANLTLEDSFEGVLFRYKKS